MARPAGLPAGPSISPGCRTAWTGRLVSVGPSGRRQGAGGERVKPGRLGGVPPDRDGDPVDRGRALVLQRSQDRVVDEVRTALPDRVTQPRVRLLKLRV